MNGKVVQLFAEKSPSHPHLLLKAGGHQNSKGQQQHKSWVSCLPHAVSSSKQLRHKTIHFIFRKRK